MCVSFAFRIANLVFFNLHRSFSSIRYYRALLASENLNSKRFLRGFASERQAIGALSLGNSDPEDLDERTYETDEITVKGRDCPRPFLQFSDYEWPEEIQKIIKLNNYKSPTPIQAQGFPVALEGRDMVGIAQTGSGKTLSFIMPAIVHIANTPPTSGRQDPIALVLAPTRELAQQIQTVAAQFKSLRSVCLFGGSHKSQQIRDLEYVKPKLIVATPGRLNDLLDCEEISAHNISYLVLDEADRMLDMGFEPQIRRIIERTPKTRQTLMWSATWPRDVQDLAKDFMKEYIQINVGGTELHANHNITQHVHTMHNDDKRAKLVDILKTEVAKGSGRKTLIFAETKYNVDGLAMLLRRQGFNAQGIHGGKTQAARDTTLNG